MAEVIELDKRKKEKLDSERFAKMASVRKILQCTMCMLKCAKCGTQMDKSDIPSDQLPFRLCSDCKEEYQEYEARLTTKEAGSQYWHNKEWMDVWKKWIDYHRSLDRYKRSKEFMMLLRELEK